MSKVIHILFFVLLTVPNAAKGTDESSDANFWFRRAASQMNLRENGALPFHMKVKFHAYPGIELTKKPQIVAGDGTYEETWLAPHHWRREVNIGGYHAIEVQFGATRKMQSSSDYEPSRVLMLLEALFNPVPRNYLDPSLNSLPLAWKVEQESANGMNFVRVSRVEFNLATQALGHKRMAAAYGFLPRGLLVQSDEFGAVTGWQDETAFSGKAVPRHFEVHAMGGRLLEADVALESPGGINSAEFDLPTSEADPGMTLRPLHIFETTGLLNMDGAFSYATPNPSSSRKVLREIIDRHGVVREAEVVDAEDLNSAGNMLDLFRTMHWRPARLDESPCEVVVLSVLR